jgi:hypothetical protein
VYLLWGRVLSHWKDAIADLCGHESTEEGFYAGIEAAIEFVRHGKRALGADYEAVLVELKQELDSWKKFEEEERKSRHGDAA